MKKVIYFHCNYQTKYQGYTLHPANHIIPITIKNSKLWLYIEHGHKKNMWLCVYLPFNSFRSRAKMIYMLFDIVNFWEPKYARNCSSDRQQKCFQPCWNVSKHTSSITTRQIVVKTNVCIEIFFTMFKDLYCNYVKKWEDCET